MHSQKQELIEIRGTKYDPSDLRFIEKLPELLVEYLKHTTVGVTGGCKFELTPTIYWHYISSTYFPLQSYKFPITSQSIKLNVKELMKKSNFITDVTHIRKDILERCFINNIINEIMDAQPMVIDTSNKENEQLNYQELHKQTLLESILSLPKLDDSIKDENPFNDLLEQEASTKFSGAAKPMKLNSKDCIKITDIISKLEEILIERQIETDSQFKIIETNFKAEKYNNQTLGPKLLEDVFKNYDKIISQCGPYLVNAEITYSKESNILSMIAIQQTDHHRQKLSVSQYTGVSGASSFEVNINESKLKDLPTNFLYNDDVCYICGKGSYSEDNLIVYCDKCNCLVHQTCYDLREIPEDSWFGTKGEVFEKEHLNQVQCSLCNQHSGIMKPTAFLKKYTVSEILNNYDKDHSNGIEINTTLAKLIANEKAFYKDNLKAMEVYGRPFTTRYHWIHMSCVKFRTEIPKIMYDSPISILNINRQDIGHKGEICLNILGVTYKCKDCPSRFHYEGGRRQNGYIAMHRIKASKILIAKCLKHRPKKQVQEYLKEREIKSHEIAAVYEGLHICDDYFKNELRYNKLWSQDYQNLIEKRYYNFISKKFKPTILLKLNSGKFSYVGCFERLFSLSVKGDKFVKWNDIGVDKFPADFGKYKFFENKINKQLLVKFIEDFSKVYISKPVYSAQKSVRLTRICRNIIDYPFEVSSDNLILRERNPFQMQNVKNSRVIEDDNDDALFNDSPKHSTGKVDTASFGHTEKGSEGLNLGYTTHSEKSTTPAKNNEISIQQGSSNDTNTRDFDEEKSVNLFEAKNLDFCAFDLPDIPKINPNSSTFGTGKVYSLVDVKQIIKCKNPNEGKFGKFYHIKGIKEEGLKYNKNFDSIHKEDFIGFSGKRERNRLKHQAQKEFKDKKIKEAKDKKSVFFQKLACNIPEKTVSRLESIGPKIEPPRHLSTEKVIENGINELSYDELLLNLADSDDKVNVKSEKDPSKPHYKEFKEKIAEKIRHHDKIDSHKKHETNTKRDRHKQHDYNKYNSKHGHKRSKHEYEEKEHRSHHNKEHAKDRHDTRRFSDVQLKKRKKKFMNKNSNTSVTEMMNSYQKS